MNNKKFSIGLVYFSGIDDLKKSISTLLAQSFTDFEIIMRDQSEKKTNGKKKFEAYEYIKKTYTKEIDEKKIRIFKGENIFHSGGHNFCISKMKGENYICASIDMIYKKNMLQKFSDNIENIDAHCFTGKLISTDNVIDSCGIDKTFYWKFFDIGQEEKTSTQQLSREVFGSSGALFCIKKNAIEKIKNIYHYFFDETLHYKNDCELMCRMKILQQKTWYDSSFYATHKRYISKNSQKSKFSILSSIEGQKKIYHSFKNTYLMKWYEKPFAWIFMKISEMRKYFL